MSHYKACPEDPRARQTLSLPMAGACHDPHDLRGSR